MRHIKRVTKDAPAPAFILQWWAQSKGNLATYIGILAGEFDGRTADYEDGDQF